MPAAAEARSPKVKMLRPQGILLVSGVIPDLGKVFAHQMKGCRKGFERCEQSFTPHPVTIIHARSRGSVAAPGEVRAQKSAAGHTSHARFPTNLAPLARRDRRQRRRDRRQGAATVAATLRQVWAAVAGEVARGGFSA